MRVERQPSPGLAGIGRGFEPRLKIHQAVVAQLVEHFLGKEEVGSSNLLNSSWIAGVSMSEHQMEDLESTQQCCINQEFQIFNIQTTKL
jgi:hypothetical protein